MMKSSTSFGFSSSLVFFFFIFASIASEAAGQYVYELTIQTGTVAEAGTDSRINVTLGNFGGDSFEIPDIMKWGIMPAKHDYFEKGNLDIFKVDVPIINLHLCNITVTSDGSGPKPGWYLEFVRVTIFKLGINSVVLISNTEFEFKQWLAIDEPPNELTASRHVCQSS